MDTRKLGIRGIVAFAVIAVLILNAVGLVMAGPVGDSAGFESDDGNLAVETTFDWNGFATTTWTGTAPYRQSDKLVAGWTFKGIEDAQATTSDTAFAGGTKQDDDCPTVITAKAPNKDDLERIYIGSKVVDGHTYLMLAWVRIPQNTTSPSAHIGFEFNKGTAGACGGSSNGLVKRVAGDMLIVYDFEGGSADEPVITLRRWATSGTCEVGSKSPPCWGPATNLTDLGFAEARVNTSTVGPVSDAIGPVPPDTLGLNEFGEAGIDLTGAGVFTPGTCESFGSVFGVSRSSGNSGTAQMKDLVGPADFTLANCGTVIVHKVTDPAGDETTSFGYTTNVTTTPATTTSPFSLKDGETNTIFNVNPGSNLNVTENDPSPGYDLTSIDCSASTVPAANYSTNLTTRAVTFSIGGDEILECTFTNTKRGTIVVEKITDDGFGSFDFTSNTLTPSPFTLTTTAAGAGGKDSRTFSNLSPGTYDVAETVPAGWNLVSATCDDGSDPASIGLAGGETVTCTFHDERERGAIEITKTRKHAAAGSGDHPHAGVTFTVTGGELPAGGVTAVTDASGVACVDGLVLSSFVGDYTVTETVPAGYVSADDTKTVAVTAESSCGDGNEATVSFSNTPLTNLTVSVDSQIDGGTASTIDCVLASGSTGPNGDGSLTINDLQPGTYVCTVVIDP